MGPNTLWTLSQCFFSLDLISYPEAWGTFISKQENFPTPQHPNHKYQEENFNNPVNRHYPLLSGTHSIILKVPSPDGPSGGCWPLCINIHLGILEPGCARLILASHGDLNPTFGFFPFHCQNPTGGGKVRCWDPLWISENSANNPSKKSDFLRANRDNDINCSITHWIGTWE